jgi:hypothetical protein
MIVMAVAQWLTQHDVRSSVAIPTEKKLHSDVRTRDNKASRDAVNRAELKLAPAVAAEATRSRGLPFNSNALRHRAAPGWHEMQVRSTEVSAQGERAGPGETPRDALTTRSFLPIKQMHMPPALHTESPTATHSCLRRIAEGSRGSSDGGAGEHCTARQ